MPRNHDAKLEVQTATQKLIDGLPVHDPDYRESWKDWESFVESLTEKISEKDETIPELPTKDLVTTCPLRCQNAKLIASSRSSGYTAMSDLAAIKLHTKYVFHCYHLPNPMRLNLTVFSATFLSCLV